VGACASCASIAAGSIAIFPLNSWSATVFAWSRAKLKYRIAAMAAGARNSRARVRRPR